MPLFHSCERRVGNFQELLTEILAGKKTEKRLRRILKPERHIFLLFEFSFSQPAGKCVNRILVSEPFSSSSNARRSIIAGVDSRSVNRPKSRSVIVRACSVLDRH
jgi:hypothetical protein